MLDALAALGMHRVADLSVLLTAAQALHDDHEAWAAKAAPGPGATAAAAVSAAGTPSPAAVVAPKDAKDPTAQQDAAAKKLRSRAAALLDQLEQWAAKHGGPSGGREADQRAWVRLGGLSWCPVMAAAPEKGLPWPASQPLLAPPRVVRPAADAWLVSATLHLVDRPAERPVGRALVSALGWDADPRVSVLAAQLLELGRLHAVVIRQPGQRDDKEREQAQAQGKASEVEQQVGQEEDERAQGQEDRQEGEGAGDAGQATEKEREEAEEERAVREAVGGAVIPLYGALCGALDGPEGDLVVMSLERPDAPAPCVWVGQGFVAPAATAMVCEGDFRPYLWAVPAELHPFGRLLAVMGVRNRLAHN